MSCYQAAGGRALGRTKGCARRGQDYYEDNQHPKALWVRPLGPKALAAGCQGPHAIAAFAHSLQHGQRRQLHCLPWPGHPRQYDVPGERTFERVLKIIPPAQLKAA